MALRELVEERLTHSAIGAFFEVYNELGYGFLESVYIMGLARELEDRKHRVAREVWVPVMYKGHELCRQRLDMIVDEKLVIEVKAGPDLPKTGTRQLHSYLRATKLEVGLLFHFGPDAKFYRLVQQNRRPHIKESDADHANHADPTDFSAHSEPS